VADVLNAWLAPLAQRVDERDRLVNETCRLAEEDASLDRASDLAERVGVAPRTLERTLREYLGLSPKWLIECRRLQAAATTLYVEPDAELSRLAVELGYVDYAHFSRRYRAVLGETPNATRSAGREAARRREAGAA
jgi:transcriptional regulator GlxA family with amidase domain